MAKILRYCTLGLALYATTLVLMYVLVDVFGLQEAAGYAIVQALTFFFSLFVARSWVFDAAHTAITDVAAKFLLSTLVFRLLNWSVFTMCFYLFSISREVGIVLAIAAVLPVKYWAEKEFVFT